jgi:hypothetical protein
MSGEVHRRKEQNYIIQVLYERYGHSDIVGEHLGMSGEAVSARLRKMGISKPRGFKESRCREVVGSGADRHYCGQPTGGKVRCEKHHERHLKIGNSVRSRRYRDRKRLTKTTSGRIDKSQVRTATLRHVEPTKTTDDTLQL